MIKSFKKLYPYLQPYRKEMMWGTLCAIITNVIGVAAPWVMKLAIDSLKSGADSRRLSEYALLILLIAVAAGYLRYLMRKILIGVSRKVELDLRNDVFAHLQRLPASYYNKQRTGDIMARMTNDMESVRMVLGPGIMYPIDTLTTAGFSIVMMLLISTKLTLWVLVLTPVVSASVFFLGKATYKLHTKIQEQYSQISDHAQENLSGTRVVRAFAQEDREIRKFSELNQEYVKRNLAMAKVQALFMPAMFFMFEIGTAMILWLGGQGIFRGELSLGGFVAFLGYLGMLAWPMIAIGWVANLFQRGAASLKRISHILDTVPEIREPSDPRTPKAIKGEIIFENVFFQYNDDTNTLTDISFTIKSGETVAIVGRTGSGKTTLVSLIPRLFDPQKGNIFIDGIPTNEWSLESLRSNIGVVPQDSLLFSDSLRENIAFGVRSPDQHEIEKASAISQMAKDVKGFRDGFDTIVGERGLTLSGGQKGRTAIARALLRDPKILILDDCLAAVDTNTEEEILRGLRKFMEGRTSLIIAHRVSTVKDADLILVLDKGKIVERGTHEELITFGGYYAELARMQELEQELEQV